MSQLTRLFILISTYSLPRAIAAPKHKVEAFADPIPSRVIDEEPHQTAVYACSKKDVSIHRLYFGSIVMDYVVSNIYSASMKSYQYCNFDILENI